MRMLLIGAGVCALLASSVAAAATLDEVTTHGIVLTVGDMDIPIAFTSDGKVTLGDGGQVVGTWRIDGDKLCTTTQSQPETCVVYPEGKKSGDVFEVTSPNGTAKIKIR